MKELSGIFKCSILFLILWGWSASSMCQINQVKQAVSFKIEKPDKVKAGKSFEVTVSFRTIGDWYIHAPTGVNKKEGMIETVVSFKCPEGIKPAGSTKFPPPRQKGVYQIYKGKDIKYSQSFTTDKDYKKKIVELGCTIEFQTCNNNLCQPPVSEEIVLKIKLK